MSRVVLETRRIRLRSWTVELGQLLEQHCNTPAVMAHLGGPLDCKSHDDLVDWLVWQEKTFKTTFWAMESRDDDRFLGFCGLVTVDEGDSTVLGACEIGWRLRIDAQGKGFAKEAAIACLWQAFEDRRTLRVVSRTVIANTSSWGLMRNLGMRPDPRLDYAERDDPLEPLIVHVATTRDWKRIRKKHPDPRLA